MSTLTIFLEKKENKIWNITKHTIVDLPLCYPTGTELTKFILNLSLYWLIEISSLSYYATSKCYITVNVKQCFWLCVTYSLMYVCSPLAVNAGLNLCRNKPDPDPAPPKSDPAPHFGGSPSSRANERRLFWPIVCIYGKLTVFTRIIAMTAIFT